MSTHSVIRVDPDDELSVILERLPSGGICILALPPHARALNGPVGAKLLKRRAESQGCQVILVTGDQAVTAQARAAGISVTGTVEEAEQLLDGSQSDLYLEPTTAFGPARGANTFDDEEPDSLDDDFGDYDEDEEESLPPFSAASPGGTARAGDTGTPEAPSPADAGAPTATFTAGAGSTGVRGHSVNVPDPAPDDKGSTPVRGHSGGPQAARARRPVAGGAGGQAPPPPRSAGDSGPGRYIMPVVLVLVPLLLLGWLAFYVLDGLLNPSATLTLRPRPNVITGTTTVRAVLDLPAQKHTVYLTGMGRLSQTEQGAITVPVRGFTLVPDHIASGELELANLNTQPLLIPAGTTFTAHNRNVSFVTTKEITLPAAKVTFSGSTNGVVTVSISAAVGGSAGNVPAGAIADVPASFSSILKVRNPRPTTGGTDRKEPAVTSSDSASYTEKLYGALVLQAKRHIDRRFGGNVELQVTNVTRSPATLTWSHHHTRASIALSIVLYGVYVHRSDLFPAARAALQPAIAAHPNEAFLQDSVAWTASWTPVRPLTATVGWTPDQAITQTIALSVSGRTKPTLPADDLLHAVAGKSKSEALSYLKGRNDIETASIALSPGWADHLPGDLTRIHINVLDPQ